MYYTVNNLGFTLFTLCNQLSITFLKYCSQKAYENITSQRQKLIAFRCAHQQKYYIKGTVARDSMLRMNQHVFYALKSFHIFTVRKNATHAL